VQIAFDPSRDDFDVAVMPRPEFQKARDQQRLILHKTVHKTLHEIPPNRQDKASHGESTTAVGHSA
jgi:hypothetical protein